MTEATKQIIKLHIKLNNLAGETVYLKQLLKNVTKIKSPTIDKGSKRRTIYDY